MFAPVRAASLEVAKMGGHQHRRCADCDPALADLAEYAMGRCDRERDPKESERTQREDPPVFVPPAAQAKGHDGRGNDEPKHGLVKALIVGLPQGQRGAGHNQNGRCHTMQGADR